MANRIQGLMQLLGSMSKSDKKNFLKTLHKGGEGGPLVSPSMRQRVTTGGEFEPMSGLDMSRLMSQQGAEANEYVKIQKLLKLLGKNPDDALSGSNTSQQLEALLLSLVTPRKIK